MENTNIIKQVNHKGHVTFQNRVYMAGVLFKINSQWPFDMVVWLRVGCGCSGSTFQDIKHYRVLASGHAILIDARYVVETTVPIPIESQDFDEARREQHLNPGTDFTDIVAHPDPDAIRALANGQAIDRFKH
jgi:hypothetical protein